MPLPKHLFHMEQVRVKEFQKVNAVDDGKTLLGPLWAYLSNNSDMIFLGKLISSVGFCVGSFTYLLNFGYAKSANISQYASRPINIPAEVRLFLEARQATAFAECCDKGFKNPTNPLYRK